MLFMIAYRQSEEWRKVDDCCIYDEVFADAYSSGVMTDAAVDFCVELW